MVSPARQALEDAINNYAKEQNGDGAVVLDFMLTAHVADMHMPAMASTYSMVHRGPIHSLMGLTEFQKEHLKQLNREEMNADADNQD